MFNKIYLIIIFLLLACDDAKTKNINVVNKKTESEPIPVPIGDNTNAKKVEEKIKSKAPIIEKIPDKSVKAGAMLAIGIKVTDPENDEMTMVFSTKDKSLPDKTFTDGILTLDIPAELPTSVINAVIIITDKTTSTAEQEFKILVEGKKQPTSIDKGLEKICDGITDPIEKALCDTAQEIRKL